jgi:hypothetical protein
MGIPVNFSQTLRIAFGGRKAEPPCYSIFTWRFLA